MIEFRKDEQRCRWNGTLMTDANHKKLFGIESELVWEDEDLIICNDTTYTNLNPSEVLMRIGDVYKGSPERDPVLTSGYINCEANYLEWKFDGKFVIEPSWLFVIDDIRPLDDFKKDYPHFDRHKYHKFYDELDEYFEKRKSL